MREGQPGAPKKQITLDELGTHFSALLNPLGVILESMREQNDTSIKQLATSSLITKAVQGNNIRLTILLIFIGLATILSGLSILQTHLVSLEVARNGVEVAKVLELTETASVKVEDIGRNSPKIILEEGDDGGVSVVVQAPVQSNKESVHHVRVPVVIPSSLRLEK